MRWLAGAMLTLLIFNTVYLMTHLTAHSGSDEFQTNAFDEQPELYEMDSVNDYPDQKLNQMMRTLARLDSKVNQLNIQLHDLKKTSQNARKDNDVLTTEQSAEERASVEQQYAEVNQQAELAVDEVIANGVMSQEDVHRLRMQMANMSPEAHQRELQRIIVALNRGDIELPPGVIF